MDTQANPEYANERMLRVLLCGPDSYCMVRVLLAAR